MMRCISHTSMVVLLAAILLPVCLLRCVDNEQAIVSEPPVEGTVLFESKERPDLADAESPAGLRIVQITSNPELKSWNVYTEARVFTPDSKRFIFIRENDLYLCDIGNNFGLRRLTDEKNVKGPSVSIDGGWLYYLVDNTESDSTLTLKKLSLTDFTRYTVLKMEGTIPGTPYRPTQIYSLTSISSDGKRLCTSCFLGDGKTENAPWGLLIFDIDKPSVSLAFKDTHFNNMHPQYCLSEDPEESHDVLLQHNHGSEYDLSGETTRLVGGDGADLHVIRDDGTNWRDIPIGRDGKEFVQGHEQWRGRFPSVLSAMGFFGGGRNRILEGFPIATDESTTHKGSLIPRGKYFDISGGIENPEFWHFSADYSGMRIVSDTYSSDKKTGKKKIHLVIGSLSGEENPELRMLYLLDTGTTGEGQSAHPHPFFSPDTRMAFFNSDREGIPQVWMVTDYRFPEF